MSGYATTSPPSATAATRSPRAGRTRSPLARSAGLAARTAAILGWTRTPTSASSSTTTRTSPDGYELVSSWVYAGQGYLDLDQAAAAVRSAAEARSR